MYPLDAVSAVASVFIAPSAPLTARNWIAIATRPAVGTTAPTARHGLSDGLALQQRAQHADGKAITGANRIHDTLHTHAGDKPFVVAMLEIGAVRTKLDHHAAGTLLDVKACNGSRILASRQDLAFTRARKSK